MGLGNQLWNIASTHGISNTIGAKHGIIGYENFKGGEFLKLDVSEIKKSTNMVTEILERSYFDSRLKFYFNLYDSALYKKRSVDTLVTGLLQDQRYLVQSLPFSYHGRAYLHDFDRTLVCNVRGGEYRLHGRFQLNKSYWQNSIDYFQRKYGINRTVAVTDDGHYCNKLGLFDDVICDSMEECFAVLMNAPFIAASNSTFSYFPIKMNANLIEATLPTFYNRPYNKYLVWASPQNLYSNYTYIDMQGETTCYEQHLKSVRNQEQLYIQNEDFLQILNVESHSFSIKTIVPDVFKRAIKKAILFACNK